MSGRERLAARSTPCLSLIRAFAPGSLDHLIVCRSTEWESATFTGERIEVEYALPDAAARAKAFALVKLAEGAAGADIPVRGWMFTDIAAEVRGDRFHVEGQAVRD
jgi:hypothetical protein